MTIEERMNHIEEELFQLEQDKNFFLKQVQEIEDCSTELDDEMNKLKNELKEMEK